MAGLVAEDFYYISNEMQNLNLSTKEARRRYTIYIPPPPFSLEVCMATPTHYEGALIPDPLRCHPHEGTEGYPENFNPHPKPEEEDTPPRPLTPIIYNNPPPPQPQPEPVSRLRQLTRSFRSRPHLRPTISLPVLPVVERTAPISDSLLNFPAFRGPRVQSTHNLTAPPCAACHAEAMQCCLACQTEARERLKSIGEAAEDQHDGGSHQSIRAALADGPGGDEQEPFLPESVEQKKKPTMSKMMESMKSKSSKAWKRFGSKFGRGVKSEKEVNEQRPSTSNKQYTSEKTSTSTDHLLAPSTSSYTSTSTHPSLASTIIDTSIIGIAR